MAEEALGGDRAASDPARVPVTAPAAVPPVDPAKAGTEATTASTPVGKEGTTSGHQETLLSARGEAPKMDTGTGAPESYSDFKFPDGMKAYEGDQMKAVHDLFKAGNLSQEQAQKFVDFHSQELGKVAGSHTEAWNSTNEQWRNELKADKTIGSGTDSIIKPEVSSSIAKLIDTHLGGDAFRAAMEVTGAGNHPAVVRGLHQIAQKMNEPGMVEGNPAREAQKRSIAQRMYPTLVKEQ